jgi:cbb3-type cytochrome oxidase maturation protein
LDIIYWLIPLSIILLAVAVCIFFWAVKNDQFSDLDSPSINILLDDDQDYNVPSATPYKSKDSQAANET